MSLDSLSTTSSLVRTTPQTEVELKGWLSKWTNYLKGYQKRWFVLSNGHLSYYRNPMEMNQSCRGSINLISAVFHTEDCCNFVVANGGNQTFHLKAANEIERQKWVTALELAKVRVIRQMDADEDDFFCLAQEKVELNTILKNLQAKLEVLTNSSDNLNKNSNALLRTLSELEKTENLADIVSKIKTINERATVYRISSKAMINASVEYYNFAQTNHKKLQKMLQHEHESRLKLEELVEVLAKQHSHLEQKAIEQQHAAEFASSYNRRDKSENENTEDEEFYDAEENTAAEFVVTFPGKAHRIHSQTPNANQSNSNKKELSTTDFASCNNTSDEHRKKSRRHKRNKSVSLVNDSGNSNDDENDLECEEAIAGYYSDDNDDEIEIDVVTRKSLTLSASANVIENGQVPLVENNKEDEFSTNSKSNLLASTNSSGSNNKISNNIKIRRTRIPDKANHSLNLWSFMKNCIGKELTKIPMPVNFNEPLSMLQRMTEEFEYAELLHKAARTSDPLEQMVYVAVFSVTCYATTSNRTGKPFNPLLGETYECDRTSDLGWKCISEQVSHHPPMLAQHCEGQDWICWREFAITSKFRGKYLAIYPLDITHLEFKSSGHHYTWRKVQTTVHNIIVGKLWVDNHGEMTITNHTTQDTCHLNFHAYSYFSRDTPRKVTGVVINKNEEIKYILNGTWDNKMEACKALNSTQKTSKNSKPVIETGTPRLIWKRVVPPPEFEKMYNMTLLSVQLNEPEEGVATTDSRLRPDQRLMEEGRWDEANEIKSKLEEKQRLARRKREEEAESFATEGLPYVPYEPIWFKKNKDPITGNPVHIFTNEYWKCKEQRDWSRCPKIYFD